MKCNNQQRRALKYLRDRERTTWVRWPFVVVLALVSLLAMCCGGS